MRVRMYVCIYTQLKTSITKKKNDYRLPVSVKMDWRARKKKGINTCQKTKKKLKGAKWLMVDALIFKWPLYAIHQNDKWFHSNACTRQVKPFFSRSFCLINLILNRSSIYEKDSSVYYNIYANVRTVKCSVIDKTQSKE